MGRYAEELAETVRPRESAVLDEDGVAEHLLRTSRWRRTSRGLYLPAGAPRSTTQRIVAAAALAPPDGVVGGWAAAYARGVDHLDGLDRDRREIDVDVLLPGGLHRQHVPGVRYRRATLRPGDVTLVEDVWTTTLLRTAVDLACWAGSVTQATVHLDACLQAGLPAAELRAAAPRDRRGSVQAREAIDAARAGARSSGETRLRLLYRTEHPEAEVLLNPSLLDRSGRLVAVPDLFDEDAGVALEYDGASWDGERAAGHRDVRQHREDNVREEAIERLGVIVVRADAADLGPHRHQTAYRLRQARLHGLARDRGRDRWLVQRPDRPDQR